MMMRVFTLVNATSLATFIIAVVLPAITPALFDAILSRGLGDWTFGTLLLVFLLILVQAPFAIVMLMMKHWKGASGAYLASLGILAGVFALSLPGVALLFGQVLE